MRVSSSGVTFLEVPNKVSYYFEIVGCPVHCKHCHSKHLWDHSGGSPLTKDEYLSTLDKIGTNVECIVFMGGEWHEDELIDFLSEAESRGYDTCLYTGLTNISNRLKTHLTYLKTGPFITQKGGLDNPNTNQVFINAKTGEKLNHLFTT